MTDRRGAWLEIDLDAIRHNLGLIRSVVGDAAVGQVVKAEAYGHGMIEVSRAIEPIVDALCVATLDEAITLRPQVGSRIIMLYPVPHPAVAEALEYDIELPVMSAADLEAIQAAARHGRPPLRIHLGVETGMGRGGLQPENVVAVAAAAHADPRLELAGLWSHLHSPEDPPTSDGQLLRFDIATTALREARVPVPPRHAAASGGIFAGDEPALDFVRPGVASYGVLDEGLPIATDAREAAARLRPAMALKARPIAFSRVAQGGTVGYGGTWRAAATVAHRGPAGGLRRRLPAQHAARRGGARARPPDPARGTCLDGRGHGRRDRSARAGLLRGVRVAGLPRRGNDHGRGTGAPTQHHRLGSAHEHGSEAGPGVPSAGRYGR